MRHFQLFSFALSILLTFSILETTGQTWSENFNSSTNFSDYDTNGYTFSSNCTGVGCYSIGTTPRTVAGWGNSLQIPASGTNLFNYYFTTGYMLLTGTSSVTFEWSQGNNSHSVTYNVRLIDTAGNITNVVLNGNKGNGNSGTVTTNFTQTGFYRIQFEFIKTGSGNASSHFVVDNFSSNVSQFAPYLIELELDCNTYKSFGNGGEPDSMTYETIIVNNGPDTVVFNEPVHVIVTLPSSPLMTFEDYIAPVGTTLHIDADNPNIAIWEISKFNVGQTLTLVSKSSYSNDNHGTIAANSSILGGLPNLYIDPNSGTDTANCFILLLPVSLLNFSANHIENIVSVNWTTTSETNNQGFEVYSSSDATNWEYLGFVEGVGNSNEETNYRYYDHSPLSQTRFYKIIQIDYDGKTEEFGPVRITIGNHFINKNITIFPNPSNGVVKIEFITHTVSNLANTDVNVYSITGQIVHQAALDFNSTNLQSLDLSHLPKGQYILKLSNNDQVHSVKIILE